MTLQVPRCGELQGNRLRQRDRVVDGDERCDEAADEDVLRTMGAARRHHLLALAKSARADCIGPQLSPYRHEAEYAIKVISTAGWCGYV